MIAALLLIIILGLPIGTACAIAIITALKGDA